MGYADFDDNTIRDIRLRLKRPLTLIGMMGVGKTRLGRALGKALGLDFVDSDQEIEKAAGMSIADIFDRYGEASFRDGEHRVMKRLLAGPVRVISTGGGAPLHKGTAEMLWDKSLTLWLKADLDVMVERTTRNDKRPLLQNGDPREILSALMEKRYPVYAKADIVVESSSGPVHQTVNQALEAIDTILRQQ